jgi:kynurenine formamidase
MSETAGNAVLVPLLQALADGSITLVDLTQPLSERTPVIRLPEPFANAPKLRRRDLSRYDDDGPAWAWSVIELCEHTGTHFDAPIHWLSGKDGIDVASVPVRHLVAPAVVIDKSAEAALDPGYLLTAADVEAFEAEHDRIEPGTWVLLRTGWDTRAHDEARFLNIGPEGSVTPGPAVDAVELLAARGILGLGAETVGTDAGQAATFDPPMPAHHILLGQGRYGLTQLANLAMLPPTGALVIVAPLRLVDGTGSPARVIALVSTDASA